MEIKNKHIKEAEKILIGGKAFDELERVKFIKNLETRDLLAVPGSGKTTALQAKLYCLAKQMPFDDNSGALVLSHTNKAVEEIEKKLRNHCPQLFQHPNFIGTVQSFVNDFLAKPYYCSHNGHKVEMIDTNYYNLRLKALALTTWCAINETKQLFNTPKIDWLYNFDILANDAGNYIYNRESQERVVINKPSGKTKPCNYKDWTDSEKRRIEENIIKLKTKLLSDGVLSFEDCYFYAAKYIERYPEAKILLQKRFRYIFIDEAQDIEKYQLDIIESIFNTKDSSCVIQRIGDINQSIYNNGKTIKVECDWKPRNPMSINSSLRLPPNIADIVDSFTLQKDFVQTDSIALKFKVEGKGQIKDVILPHLILFDNDTTNLLKHKFEELIKQHNLFDGLDGKNTKKGFKIIGWSGTWKDEDSKGRLRLENIFPNEYRLVTESKKNKVNLCEYLTCNPENKTLRKYFCNIIEALCGILRIAQCMNTATRKGKEIQTHYTSQSLWKYLIEESRKTNGKLSEQDLLVFKSQLYIWSFSIATNENIEKIYNQIKSFIDVSFSNWFGFSIGDDVSAFLGDKYENAISTDTSRNTDTSSIIPIDVCSIHSVKGQTHCATMYVETSYHSYETEKKQVIDALKKESHSLLTSKNTKRSIEAFKMMYVGFSRPTHLLCFAMHKNNLNDECSHFFGDERNGWKLIDLTSP